MVAGYSTSGGTANTVFNGPTAIYLDLNRTLYIVDSLNYRVQKWINGQPLAFTVAGGRGSGSSLNRISMSYGVYVDSRAQVYVSEFSNNRVTRWANTTIGVIVSVY